MKPGGGGADRIRAIEPADRFKGLPAGDFTEGLDGGAISKAIGIGQLSFRLLLPLPCTQGRGLG